MFRILAKDRSFLKGKYMSLLKLREPTESVKTVCNICGEKSIFSSWEPLASSCKRNSFYCQKCNSVSRTRHVAKIILELFPRFPEVDSLYNFSKVMDLKILNTCASGAIHEYLKSCKNYTFSEYYDSVNSGEIENGVLCEDLTSTSFKNNEFDLIITEDIIEHISDPKKAFNEIRRILKPGGYHISTIPVFFDKYKSEKRAIIEDGKLIHVLKPEYHGDPNRSDGILVFTDFGLDLVDNYCSIIGDTIVYESHGNVDDEQKYAIYNSWVYASRKINSIEFNSNTYSDSVVISLNYSDE